MVKRSAIITGATVVFCALLCSGIVFADDDASVDDVSIVVPTACTLSGTGTGTHTATINPGQYVADIGTTTLKALCNDNNGFAIYAAGYTGNTIGETNSNKLVGQNTAETIATGLATSGDTSNWAMKLATDPNATYPVTIESAPNASGGSDASFSAYHAVPNEYTKVATRLQSTDVGTTATGSTLTTTYATYISAGQVGDTYNGKVIYTLVHPNNEIPAQPRPTAPGYISYYANSNMAEGTMGRQSARNGNIVTLFAPNFSREGYGFAGWSDVYDYATNPNTHIYGPNENITAPEGTTANGLALYAVWVKSEGSMQDTSKATSICNRLTPAIYDNGGDTDESTWSIMADLSSISALTDTRDGQTYAIAKLTDGNCWMIENLRLADTHQQGLNTLPTTLTTTNTNNPLNNGTNVTLKHNYTDSITYDTLSPTSSDDTSWCKTSSAECLSQSRINTDNTTNRAVYNDTDAMSTDSNLYSYGNYYNWYSATAGNGDYNKSSGYAAGDLCPKGWHLPYGGNGTDDKGGNTSGGFYYLAESLALIVNNNDSIKSARIRHFPNNFIYSSKSAKGATGNYWSLTASSNNSAYAMNFYNMGFLPAANNQFYKYAGMGVRCLLGA